MLLKSPTLCCISNMEFYGILDEDLLPALWTPSIGFQGFWETDRTNEMTAGS